MQDPKYPWIDDQDEAQPLIMPRYSQEYLCTTETSGAPSYHVITGPQQLLTPHTGVGESMDSKDG